MQALKDNEQLTAPLHNLEEWDDFVAARYRQGKSEEEFRNFSAEANPTVTEFYRQNHAYQTLDFVLAKKPSISPLKRRSKSIWEAAEFLNTLVDDSDPDTDLTQIEHLLQTSEAIRRDGHPRWFVLAGLIHDLGKVLCLFGEPQWAVVGDTFPVGCAYSDQIVFPEFFAANPDSRRAGVPDAVRHLRAELRARQRAPVLGPRRIHLPRRQGLPSRASAVHDPLPLLLSGAQARRLSPPDERP